MKRLLLALPFVLLLAAPTAAAARPQGFAYGMILNMHGDWVGPTRNGSPDLSVFDKMREAQPRYLRVVTHARTHPTFHVAPIPRPEGALEEMERLRDAGIHLGVGINAYYEPDTDQRESMSVTEVLQRACAIRTKTDEVSRGLYDWIFLDFALQRSKRGLQKLVDGLHAGRECGGQGWKRVMTNATAYTNPHQSDIPKRTWGHAARLSLMDDGTKNDPNNRWRRLANRAARFKIPALTKRDREFPRYVHEKSPNSLALLKLEIPNQAANFGTLRKWVQKTLLRRWAEPQDRLNYKLILPLFVQRTARGGYDCRKEDTCRTSKRLLHKG